jgi:hypothetical protein
MPAGLDRAGISWSELLFLCSRQNNYKDKDELFMTAGLLLLRVSNVSDKAQVRL